MSDVEEIFERNSEQFVLCFLDSGNNVEGFTEGGSWPAANLAEVPLPASQEEARSGNFRRADVGMGSRPRRQVNIEQTRCNGKGLRGTERGSQLDCSSWT